jgi:hypothetical protein
MNNANATIIPDTTIPLVIAPNQPTPFPLGVLSAFVGTWNSPAGSSATGYNVMSLPQISAPGGYITKNFPYYEEITFAQIAGNAPNRGGNFTQNCNVLFYEQRVYIANNPATPPAASPQNTLIHAENGSWLYRVIVDQLAGPYGPGNVTPPVPLPTQAPTTQYVKQVSVPHGNSMLLVGNATSFTGSPTIPPTPLTMLPFSDPNQKIIDPNSYLTNQLDGLAKANNPVVSYVELTVSSLIDGAGIHNTSFELQHASVDSFTTTWYIETLKDGQVQLQYTQSIFMTLMIGGVPTKFRHVDANTLIRVEIA